ncbi:MAG: hypothetical protein IPL65_05095 [Lewinellaceae bacterium]|nr:hypothetical protein [Lewinellaceae bacterium]
MPNVLLLLLLLDYFLILASILYTPFRVRTGTGWGSVGLIAALIFAQIGLGSWILGNIADWKDPEWGLLLYFLWIFGSGVAGIGLLWKMLGISNMRQGGPGKPPFSYRWIANIHLVLVLLIGFLLLGVPYVSGNSVMYFVLFLGVLVFAFYQQDKNYKRASIPQVLDETKGKPVLYLRAFKTENIGFWSGRLGKIKSETGALGKGSWMIPIQSLTFAEFFGKSFSDRIGPFIMLGNPHDFLPLSGGYTDYYKDSNWQQHVLDYLEKSAAIVMPVVKSDNLDWELNQIRNLGYAPKLFILTSPVQNKALNGLSRFFMKIFGTLPIEWAAFRSQLASAGLDLPTEDPGLGVVLKFDATGNGRVLFRGAVTPNQYTDAISGAVPSKQA